MASESDQLEALLSYLKSARGFDFTAYKRPGLTRRVAKRMEALDIADYGAYLDHLQVHPDEFGRLFNTILINVTGFFRDEAAWSYIRDSLIPEILAGKGPSDAVRVWSAGCASGEEAYSAAMLLCDAMGSDAFRERVKIYGTDASEAALAKARQATYSEREVEDVPERLRRKYFAPGADGSFVFDTELRRCVIFGRHDLINDSPISRADLLLCRNTLMYFNSEYQERILHRLHYAVTERGFLVLGKAEMLLSGGNLFTAVDLKRRVFRKVPRPPGPDRAWATVVGAAGAGKARPPGPAGNDEGMASPSNTLQEVAVRTGPVAQFIIDVQGRLAVANDQARVLLGISGSDLGRPFAELSASFRPLELAPHVQRVAQTQSSVVIPDIEWTIGSDRRFYEVTISPLMDGDHRSMGLSVTFAETTRYIDLERHLRDSNQALETAQEELQTTNEELHSTVEELETTNEELQSTNEELETMNEELQTTNEELRTSNEELRERSDELDDVEGFWRLVVSGLPAGMAVLDVDLRVQVWNARAEDLWGLRADEVRGQQFLELDIGLPVEQLRGPIRQCMTAQAPQKVVLPATNRRGRAFECRVEVSCLGRGEGAKVLVLMQEAAMGHDQAM